MTEENRGLRRELRLVEAYAVICTVAFAVFLLAGARRPAHSFDTITVHRINVVDSTGQPRLIIAGPGQMPGPMFSGKEYPASLSQGRNRSAGLVFINGRGDEDGGLTWNGRPLPDGGHTASGNLSFDQYRQDEKVSVWYHDAQGHSAAGLYVWDRPNQPLEKLLPLIMAERAAKGARRDSLRRELVAAARKGGPSARRAFLGTRDGTAMLQLADRAGHVRLRLSVDSAGQARIELLDDSGHVTSEFPRRR